MPYYEYKVWSVCVCCREIVIILAIIDGPEDSIFSASQSEHPLDLILYASMCGSIKLHTSNIGMSMGTANQVVLGMVGKKY